jgi:hypothetical protein
MEAEVNTFEKSILERVARKLIHAQQELDELAVQLALGKADAKDKFEEVKADFKQRVNEFKFTTIGKILGMAAERMQAHIDELEEHLSDGRAETHEKFEAQLNKILGTLKAFEIEIKDRLPKSANVALFQYDIEKFKLELTILRLRYELKRIELHDEFYDGLAAARKSVKQMKQVVSEKVKDGVENLDDFKEHVAETFAHMRKAVKSL